MKNLRKLLGALVIVFSPLACKDRTDAQPDTQPDVAVSSGNAGSSGVALTVADFGALRWLEGSWRGALPKGGYFYERYHFANDSTIAMQGFTDSTFSVANDSASIVLRGGKVYDRGASSEWIVSRLDSTSVDFSPTRRASNRFTWQRVSNDRWTATLNPVKGAATVYNMERIGRAK